VATPTSGAPTATVPTATPSASPTTPAPLQRKKVYLPLVSTN
jgi:hypothetical protein